MSSKQLSAGNRYSRYIKKQVPSCERGITRCSERRINKERGQSVCCKQGWWGGYRQREGTGDSGKNAQRTCIISRLLLYRSTQFPGHHDWQLRHEWGNACTGERVCLHNCATLHSPGDAWPSGFFFFACFPFNLYTQMDSKRRQRAEEWKNKCTVATGMKIWVRLRSTEQCQRESRVGVCERGAHEVSAQVILRRCDTASTKSQLY